MNDTAKPDLLYVTEIGATPEKVWQALTDPAFTARYWYGTRLESDWKPGSPITFHKVQGEADTGTMLIADRPRKLAYSWVVNFPALAGERASRVTFTLEPSGAGTRLSVSETGFNEVSLARRAKVFKDNSQGWAEVIVWIQKYAEAKN